MFDQERKKMLDNMTLDNMTKTIKTWTFYEIKITFEVKYKYKLVVGRYRR